VLPELVAEVKFVQRTHDGMLRLPVFMRLRPDKPPTQAEKPEPVEPPVARSATVRRAAPSSTVGADDEDVLDQLRRARTEATLSIDGQKLAVTNLNKVLWPAFGSNVPFTKRDYLMYLTTMAPYLLEYLRDRPLTLVRYPSGIHGSRFFQRHVATAPGFVERVALFSEHGDRDQDHLMCNNLATLLWLGQYAALELHAWYARTNPFPDGKRHPRTFTGSAADIERSLLNYPDFLVFDLDPYIYSGKEAKGAEPELNRKAFRGTAEVALGFKDILDGLGMPSFVKTSGKTGLHVFVPVLRNLEFDAVRGIAKTIAEYVEHDRPRDVTTEWTVTKRTGKIFLDYNQNGRGKTLPPPYATRAASGATVSAPLHWDEVRDVYPTSFTMRSMPERVRKVGDLWAGILDAKADLRALGDGTLERQAG
jgi:bifunctional non-homologous end joining protein LigD